MGEPALHVDHLWLRDVRNHAELEVAFAPGLTVVTGANGQGKTSVLEAVGYLATGRSFRGAATETVVRVGAEAGIARADGVRDGRAFLVEAELRPGGRSRLQLNHQRVTRTRDLYDALLVSVFTPDDLVLVKGGPSERRAWLDDVLAACSPRLEGVRADLERVVRQKNALLRQARGRLDGDATTTLGVWNDQLTELGERLALARVRALERLGPAVAEAYAAVAGAEAPVRLVYLAPWRAAGLAAALEEARDDEIRRGMALVGPHRDDVLVELAGLPGRTHASQGEQRTLALAMRLGAHRLVAETVGVTPVLLLDDLFSELDPGRSAALLAHLPAGQALLTTAGPLPEGTVPDAVIRLPVG